MSRSQKFIKIKDIGEFGLINWIRKASGSSEAVVKGIGDDSAAINLGRREILLVTSDCMQEGVHFDRKFIQPTILGIKLLRVNLSDIAAMGGNARWCVITAGLNRELGFEWLKSFMEGLLNEAEKRGISLVGGDTVESPKGNYFSLTLLGTIPRDRVITRAGAEPGHRLFVTGNLGDSCLGLNILKRYGNFDKVPDRFVKLVKRHLLPSPRVYQALLLARYRIPSAMIDISDGLVQDLNHILEESKTGARLYAGKIPLSPEYLRYARQFSKDFWQPALSGGEDYELLFTVPESRLSTLYRLRNKFRCRLTEIGEITLSRMGMLVYPDTKIQRLKPVGYQHFV